MYFSELLSKITLGGQNQTPSKQKIRAGKDIMTRANRQKENAQKYEDEIVCRVINGSKVKKRKYHKEEEKTQQES